MEFVDIDEEVQRLQLEGDAGFERALLIAELADAYPDLKLFRDCWGMIRHCSASVNGKVDRMDVDSCHRCDGKPIKIWPFLITGKAGERLYSDPPAYIIADQNQEGFGEIPRTGWMELLESYGIAASVIEKVKLHVRAHPAIDYFGDDDAGPQGSAATGSGADAPNDLAK